MTGPTAVAADRDAIVVRRVPLRLEADRSRVVTRLFIPGHEGFDHQDSRTSSVLERILALDDDEIQSSFDSVVARFSNRHRDLIGTFDRHATELADRLDPGAVLSETRRLLVGATFTSEYSIEGAALCNPSMVAHPDQSDVATGGLRFVMSVRSIGEGHRSSIGFRTGVITGSGDVQIDPVSRFASSATTGSALFDGTVFRRELQRLGGDGEDANFVLDGLPERFRTDELEEQLERLQGQLATRKHSERAVSLLRQIAERTYGARFADDTVLTERVLIPATSAECLGMEDARFVRFVDADLPGPGDGPARTAAQYYATYTAYNGHDISQQLLETTDFCSFTSSPIVGAAATNKGLALFPRRIGGRFAALSRSDRETNTIAFSDNLRVWDEALPCQSPVRAWEVLQLGNCGPPIETDAGWLVLTHGVGPMRTYSIGAILLDRDDPTRVIGRLRQPLLTPSRDEQDGYVPNVVYSCGALEHGGVLVLPFGIGDSAIGVATVSLRELLDALQASPPED